ncbi:DNA-3-methyladenine glycosylase [soil metagenome]
MTAEFYDRPAEVVARDLLGARVVSEVGGDRCVGRIVETEAYTGPDDDASHGHIRFGRTPRNGAMFGPPGRAYVYRIYGIHWCLNVVTGADGFPAAVLLRAAEPLEGAEFMRLRRPGRYVRDLLRGPGNLCRALGVDGTLDHHPVSQAPLQLEPGSPVSGEQVRRGPRIGISRNAEAPLRFWIAGSPWVSARAS